MTHPPINFTRRAHRPGDEQLLLDLLTASFGRWPKVEIACEPVEHLRWKCSNTDEAREIHRITQVSDRVVSSVFCWIQNCKVGDQVYRAIQGVDRAVHPDFQRQGLGEQIIRWRAAHPDDQPCDFQFGPRSGHPGMIVLQERAQQAGASFAIGNRIRVVTLPLLNDASHLFERPPSCEITIRAADAFDDRIDVFCRAAAEPYAFMVERTREQLNWRYADARSGLFAIHLAEHDGELLGYSTLRISHERGYIADLLALPGRLDVVGALVEDAVFTLAAIGALRVDWWLSLHHPYQEIARKRGFDDKRVVDIELFPRNNHVDLTFLRDPSVAVHIAAGDTDLV